MRHVRPTHFLCALLFLFAAASARADYDMVVAQDGSGDYTTVQAAIFAVPKYNATRTTIFIKAGTYTEQVVVPKAYNRITLVGEDRDTTVITGNAHATVNADESVDGTIDTPTFFVKGKEFGARNITFANTAGDVGPAVAMWVHANHAHFRNCAFLGYQDTLCTTGDMAYFKRCYIEGAIDFIFGSSAAVFQHCTIHPLDSGYITAANTDQGKSYGLVFKGCLIHGDAPAASVSLGRPWGEYAKVVFLNCDMDAEIIPEGWSDWEGGSDWDGDDDLTISNVYDAEYNTTGGGADPAERVAWSTQLTANDVSNYTLGAIFALPTVNTFGAELAAAPVPWYEDY